MYLPFERVDAFESSQMITARYKDSGWPAQGKSMAGMLPSPVPITASRGMGCSSDCCLPGVELIS